MAQFELLVLRDAVTVKERLELEVRVDPKELLGHLVELLDENTVMDVVLVVVVEDETDTVEVWQLDKDGVRETVLVKLITEELEALLD